MQTTSRIHPLAISALSALIVFAGGGGLIVAAVAFARQSPPTAPVSVPAPAVVVENNFGLRIQPLGKVGQDFKFRIREFTAAAFTQQVANGELPEFSTAAGQIFQIETTGALPARVALSILLPPAATDAELLELHAWDGTTWRFVPSLLSTAELQTEIAGVPRAVAIMRGLPAPPIVGGVLEAGETFAASSTALEVVFPAGLLLQNDGSLLGTLTDGIAPAAGQRVMPVVRAQESDGSSIVAAMLASPAARQLNLSGLQDLATNSLHAGVVLDYGLLQPALRSEWSAFISELAALLHAQQKQLGVVVPANAGADPNADGYDLRSIGAEADWIELR